MEKDKILIVGGYGHVGFMIASKLAPQFPGQVLIAGRDPEKAIMASFRLGHGTEGRKIDIDSPDAMDALEDVSLVLVCLDQTDIQFVAGCLSRGINYVDITAQDAFLKDVETLDGVARQSRTTAVLSVGAAPGLSNLLAARVAQEMSPLDSIDILLQFGTGDRHGKAAVQWMFDNLDTVYQVNEHGVRKSVRSFGESQLLCLPGDTHRRRAYRFNFADQHVISRHRDIPSVSTWVRFDSRATTWIFATLSRMGFGRLLRFSICRTMAVWLFMHFRFGSDMCAVGVTAKKTSTAGTQEKTIGVVGRCEAKMTAIVAAETARQILVAPSEHGVFHIEQTIEFMPVIEALKKELPEFVAVF